MFAPDASAPPLAWLLAPASIGFIWLAGHFASHAFPSPCRFATGPLTGLLILLGAVLGCDALGLRVTFVPLALALAASAFAGQLLALRRGLPPPSRPPLRLPSRSDFWWLVPCGFAFVSVLVRAVLDPLAGWDNLWRWNHLALVLHDLGSLSAYPPVSAADFVVYPWCDGIPPLVSVSNLWIYLASGSTAGSLVVFRLALELVLIGGLTWRIARELWGPVGARFAVLTLSGSALFLGSISIAQETGLGGLGILSLVAFALSYRAAPCRSTAVWIGVAAAFAALCRDYNLLYLPVALAILLLQRAPRHDLFAALAAMLVLVLPWYARNALQTGNPLFAHTFGGLLPGNSYHEFLMGEIRRFWAPSATPGFGRTVLSALGVGLGLALFAALPGLRKCFLGRSAVALALPAAATITLWLLSISATAGGVIYSLRTLGPLVPLLAVGAGAWSLRGRRTRIMLAGLLVLGAVDASRRHWIFLLDPLAAPLPYTWRSWHPVAEIHSRYSRETLWSSLAASSAGGGIVADNPGYTVLGARRGIAITPLTSPALASLTNPGSPADLVRIRDGLLAAGFRFVVLGEDTTFSRETHARHPGVRLLYALPPAGIFEGLRIYDLRLLAVPPSALPPSQPAGP